MSMENLGPMGNDQLKALFELLKNNKMQVNVVGDINELPPELKEILKDLGIDDKKADANEKAKLKLFLEELTTLGQKYNVSPIQTIVTLTEGIIDKIKEDLINELNEKAASIKSLAKALGINPDHAEQFANEKFEENMALGIQMAQKLKKKTVGMDALLMFAAGFMELLEEIEE